MAAGGMVMGIVSFRDCTSHAMANRVCKFHAARFRILSAARMHSGLCHGIGAVGARVGNRGAFDVFLSWSGGGPRRLRRRPEQRRIDASCLLSARRHWPQPDGLARSYLRRRNTAPV